MIRPDALKAKFCYQQNLTSGMTNVNYFLNTNKTPVFTCKLCSYYNTNKHNFKIHMRTHSGEKPYACHLCCYRGAQKNHLDNHIKTHTGEKAFACSMCSYRATQKIHLEKHLRIHNFGSFIGSNKQDMEIHKKQH